MFKSQQKASTSRLSRCKRIILHVSMAVILLNVWKFGVAGESATANAELSAPPIDLDKGLPLIGTNLSSAEWGVSSEGYGAIPGTHGRQYVWPHEEFVQGYDSIEKFSKMGMTSIRLPFRWERLQPRPFANFDPQELHRLKTTVAAILENDMYVVLDLHNYARYGDLVIGPEPPKDLWGKIKRYFEEDTLPPAALGDIWFRLAEEYRHEPRVIFALMNEPMQIATEIWLHAANTAIAAIRSTGAKNLILVPGVAWSSAKAWHEDWYGTPNAVAMLKITDPLNYYAFDVHQYMNKDGSNSDSCVSETIGSKRMKKFTEWLIQHDKRAYLGEFAAADDKICLAALRDQLNFVEKHSKVYIGWAWWAAGPRCVEWVKIIDPFCHKQALDTPQFNILKEFLRQ